MASENNKMDIESSIPCEMNIYIDNILGIKSTNPNYQNYFSNYLNLISILKELKFKEKINKKSEKDIKQETIEQIENLSKNSAKQIKSEKEKNFNSFIYSTTKNKTIFYNTAEQDEISPTLSAYYSCNKNSKQILTDHQAAVLKDAKIDTDYLKNSKDLNSEDFETSTNNNNGNNNNVMSNSKEKNNSTPLLNKKRKGSISNKTNYKNSNKKVKKNEKNIKENNKEKNNSEDENNNTEENNNKNNNNNNNNEEYCLPTCKLGRKNTEYVMVMCDKCKKWYHALCVNEPENITYLAQKDWLCPFCKIKKNDKMMLEKPMINNIKYNNNNNNNHNNNC